MPRLTIYPKSHYVTRREIVLAAGALQSPQLLELSGIGNGDLLREHGEVVVVLHQDLLAEPLEREP